MTGQLSDDDPIIARAMQKIADADAELQRLEARRDARSAEWQPLGQLIERAERWLADLPADAVIEQTDDQTPKLNKGETPTGAVDRLRRKRRDLLADLVQVDAAPITSTTAKALARAEVEALADRGRPDLFGVVEHGDGIRWPQKRINAQLNAFVAQQGAPAVQGHANTEIPDTLALVAWMYRDDLIAALDAEVDSISDDAAALTPEERDARREDIRASILDVERAEVALIDAMPGIGAYRADVDPRALLAVTGPAPEAA